MKKGDLKAGRLRQTTSAQIAVSQIDANPYQPRPADSNPQEIASLADSLRQHGMLQPVLVRAVGDRYQLIAGERRLRASIEARLSELPARVLVLDDQHVFEIAMVENLQREDLNAVDKATAFREYLTRYGVTQEELAGRLGLDRSTISNLIRLLELPDAVLDAVRGSEISQGHAREHLAWPGKRRQPNRGFSPSRRRRPPLGSPKTEALVAMGTAPSPARPRVRKDAPHAHDTRPPHLLDFEQRLNRRLGTTVLIRAKNQDRGQIIIDYHSRDEFDRLASLFQESGAPVAGS